MKHTLVVSSLLSLLLLLSACGGGGKEEQSFVPRPVPSEYAGLSTVAQPIPTATLVPPKATPTPVSRSVPVTTPTATPIQVAVVTGGAAKGGKYENFITFNLYTLSILFKIINLASFGI